MTARIRRFLDESRPPTPCLVIDLDVVRENYLAFTRLLPQAAVYYAVKANPAPEIVSLLVRLGSSFDCASIYEIRDCLAAGAPPRRLSFGNTIKKSADIEAAHRLGVDLFAFDSQGELRKLAEAAPGARVYCRIAMTGEGADWPLGRKFGCEVDMARDLMLEAGRLGLDPYGLSFHIGSQQRDVRQWDVAFGQTAMLFTALDEAGVKLGMVNVGGGFPARTRKDGPGPEEHMEALVAAARSHFGNRMPNLIVEPGRALVGDAGLVQSEVVLISQKGYRDEERWVYLDIGKFGGLIETMDEAIQYRITTERDGAECGPVVLAGPTCDEADVIYQHSDYRLPLSLQVGDKVAIESAGAYTASYSSVNFNGLPPLATYCI